MAEMVPATSSLRITGWVMNGRDWSWSGVAGVDCPRLGFARRSPSLSLVGIEFERMAPSMPGLSCQRERLVGILKVEYGRP
jgi:hypothetical protein